MTEWATLWDIECLVAKVMREAHDDERAHGIEDDLWELVLGTIAAGHPQPQMLAQAALQTTEAKFIRWCS